MYQINGIYVPHQETGKIKGAVRLLEVTPKHVAFIHIDEDKKPGVLVESKQVWDELFFEEILEEGFDPFATLTSLPSGLPDGAQARLANLNTVIDRLLDICPTLTKPRQFANEISNAAKQVNRSKKTVQRWVEAWLRAGRNPVAVVRTFIENEKSKIKGLQETGRKRGPKNTKPELGTTPAIHEVQEKIDKAFEAYVAKRRMTWKDAYFEMLTKLFNVPEPNTKTDAQRDLFLSSAMLFKYKIPSWYQFRNRCRKLQNERSKTGLELPRGSRGRSTAPGPGFFEIDATHFQIQLVSVLTKSELVGRPSVYLIVDIFSGAITGYALTLENPSWAVAALALKNCFSDKQATFDRLGLPYSTSDWACKELPTMLRADRAELVSNMGQDFAKSGIRVNITPSMEPIAKGTVEGKNSEIKRPTFGRFNLPGLFKKHRKRREADGKKSATLNIMEFEIILVEIILDLNKKPIRPSKMSRQIALAGPQAASRIGLYEWGLDNHPGFTRAMRPNFVYEHLMTQGEGVVTPRGILFHGETFVCDRLRDLGFLSTAVAGHFNIRVAYSPLYSGEIFLFDKEKDEYFAATNHDIDMVRLKASFYEAKELRAIKKATHTQAEFIHSAERRKRVNSVQSTIKAAAKEKSSTPALPSSSKARIRTARAKEKRNLREPADRSTQGIPATTNQETPKIDHAGNRNPAVSISLAKLWEEVDAIAK